MKGSQIHILGVAYKRDIDDVRESPALDIIHLLLERGARVSYSDPHVPSIKVDGQELFSTKMNGEIEKSDCVAIITDHSSVNYEAVLRKARLIVDTRNTLRGQVSKKIVRL